ncbi:MAG: (E)-4-hydroxy-3-methylbut-2-enyl-diphosphate synthase [Prevotellaceae bacterium]|jgi:(E)-4-hydroxy-3-methylbut-2-enyl-diphosphate synthase|nr:(E)-4-hydroxy-3-methylbut-2-enyl-diphosphate synthase [Prevotellaceae bacterium]
MNSVRPAYQRRKAGEVLIGGVAMGGDQPVRVQTMCNTPTQDIGASVEQCRRIARAGADYVRLTTQGLREVDALMEIKRQLRGAGFSIPLIADVHFNAKVAIAAAAVADKVRINPGNFARDRRETLQKFVELLRVCRQHQTALRIGVNHGSLSERIMKQYGDTPEGMVASAMELLHVCRDENFPQAVVSMKSSNTRVMVHAYRLLAARMEQNDMTCPLHLGVTEAGDGMEGRIKSAAGIGTLLSEGYGDTVRVSLTEPPENEIPVAKTLVRMAPQFPYTSKTGHKKQAKIHCRCAAATIEELWLQATCKTAPRLLDGYAGDLQLTATVAGEKLPDKQAEEIALTVLQATRVRFTRPEYIACPGCGRTLFDLQKTLAEVRAATSHLTGTKIAVMGCIVNGPGEMADADFGYVGAGRGKITLYRGKEVVKKNIPEEEAVNELLRLIDPDIKN